MLHAGEVLILMNAWLGLHQAVWGILTRPLLLAGKCLPALTWQGPVMGCVLRHHLAKLNTNTVDANTVHAQGRNKQRTCTKTCSVSR